MGGSRRVCAGGSCTSTIVTLLCSGHLTERGPLKICCHNNWPMSASRRHPFLDSPFCHRLFGMRACVEGLQREQENLRAELSLRGERRSRGRSRSLPQSISQSSRESCSVWFGGEQGKSPFVECHGDFDRQCGVVCQVKHRWCRKLSARYGLRAQRVGEASHPGPRTQNRHEADNQGEGVCHTVLQGEGGRARATPLMPGLFSFGQHDALLAVQDTLRPIEYLWAFQDDIFLVTEPARIATVHREFGFHLWTRARISPCTLGICAHQVVKEYSKQPESHPDAVVWKGDESLPTTNQGVVVLGALLGHADFVARKLEAKMDEHRVLFRRILAVQDLQCAWLLLLFCAATRANYFLRVVEPAMSQRFAAAHDEDVWSCIQELSSIEGTTRVRQLSNLPFALGGLGLRSAVRGRIAAYLASWADSITRIRERHLRIVDLIGASLFHNRFSEGSCLQAAALCRDRLLTWVSVPQSGET